MKKIAIISCSNCDSQIEVEKPVSVWFARCDNCNEAVVVTVNEKINQLFNKINH